MVTHFFNAHLGQARCRAGRYRHHGRSKPETCRLDGSQRQKSDDDLRDPWPWRSFLRRKHDSEEISQSAVRRDARSHRCHAKAGVGSRGQHILETTVSRTNRFNTRGRGRTQGRRYRTGRGATCGRSPRAYRYGQHDLSPRPFDRAGRCRRRRLQRCSSSSWRVERRNPERLDRGARQDRVAQARGRYCGTQEARGARYAESYRRNTKIHSRLRQDRYQYQDRVGAVQPDARDLSRAREPGSLVVVGTGNEAGHLNPVAFSHASAKFWHVTVCATPNEREVSWTWQRTYFRKLLRCGGLDRWNSFETVQATIVTGGQLYGPQCVCDVVFLPAPRRRTRQPSCRAS